MGSMGVTSMTSMIACDSSFMIKSLYKFRIPGIDYDFSINTTHVALLIVSIFILVVAIIARIKINNKWYDSGIKSLTFTGGSNGEDDITIGSTVSAYIDVTMNLI